MTPSKTVDLSLVRRTARSIRDQSMAAEPGERLGSEDEMMAQTGVSRPTLRQASKLVEQEQLLRIKRGVGGGYFSERPQSGAVSHITAIYLHKRDARLKDILAAHRPLFTLTVREAAQNMTPAFRQKLLAHANDERAAISRRTSTRTFVRSTKQFGALLAEASGNPLVQLFQDIVFDLSALVGESIWIGHPERVESSRKHRLNIIDAILDGDAELAAIAANQTCDLSERWAAESTATFNLVAAGSGRSRIGKTSREQ